MSSSAAVSSNVIRFPGPRALKSSKTEQKGLLDMVYTSGAMMVAADDRETKALASRLQVFGFLNISEINTDGSARKLRPSEVARLSMTRPWRLSRPSFDALPAEDGLRPAAS
ncbi:hypothetical protein [Enterovirga rhinocerotis]|uniref:Uncharacterized protein n=1 Tax=Enterovirga rhinocerotis TaxID=1339210 RepID=A0A4R7C615_9HYPH|nr:hypothetical protein [Enterovirga rhinocerotis]TDR93671.1 hypothetical protein EV668_0936 [Enterovirga rhinocerotis]